MAEMPVELTFRDFCSKKEVQALAALQAHIDVNPQMFGQLLALLLETVVYDDCPNQWALSRPMLGLILTNEVLFTVLQVSMRARVDACVSCVCVCVCVCVRVSLYVCGLFAVWRATVCTCASPLIPC